ncbi:SNF2-related protein [Desulfurispira natronophila]|uniref:ERCC4-related helicase n=1 Tax=Desulfurispira natronophila TaxID=682562 RepID=A0A7W8DGC9_9BACT|nr:SNF2-related protein [Desulfurispira natronophila]MBB5021361.1 ERCC4-related helicase [Desulfurispira natronophila]
MITNHHAKYYAHELKRAGGEGVDRLSQSLFDANVDLNPHQIEAALFALKNPLRKGVVLADEVGLGKTIEAGLVLCQYWAERKRKLLIICPASLRRQWAQELLEKFNLPSVILDMQAWKRMQKQGIYNPLGTGEIVIISLHFAARIEEQLVGQPWDLAVIDEAHKLRNAHRESNRMGQAIKRALDGRKKLLLTATPLQNSLLELYGLSTVIDEHLFGDVAAFRKQYMAGDPPVKELKQRLETFVKRTLRKHVLEYIRYTERKTLTIPFTPTPAEQALYDSVSDFLQREDSYALPKRQRHLTGLILRKLLASSSYAVLNTLETIKKRLILLEQSQPPLDDLISTLVEDDDLESDYLDEFDESEQEEETPDAPFDALKLRNEIQEIESFISQARSVTHDSKLDALLKALDTGFTQMASMGAPQKAIIFTESKRTQEYVTRFLAENGYGDGIVNFSGSNTGPAATAIYQQWLQEHAGSSRITGSLQVDRRTSLIDYFKDHGRIMIATEAAAEGVNLQFCSLIINYDLPWNPQRIEQRIGRCHRYGQRFDVVVINFLNQKNLADQRVLELLQSKFSLFDGVFGASDEILGSIESGIDFEKHIQSIYDTCRTPEAITQAFDLLQKQLEQDINTRLQETQKLLLENFDENIHELMRLQLDEAQQRLGKVSRWFWQLTRHVLAGHADFDDTNHSFVLEEPPIYQAPRGKYELIRANGHTKSIGTHSYTYRLTHPLGEHVLDIASQLDTPPATIIFDYANHPTKIAVADQLCGQSGYMKLSLLVIEAFQTEEHLIFTGTTDSGQWLDSETCQRLFSIGGTQINEPLSLPATLDSNNQRLIDATLAKVMEANNQFFQAERDKLEKWADDKILAAEQALTDTKAKIRALKRDTRMAQTIEQQQEAQKELRDLERLLRRQRQQIFQVEDEIGERRDQLIEALEQRMKQKTSVRELFTIRWRIQ